MGTLVAVPIIAAHPPLGEQVRAARLAGADLVELRVDCIDDVPAIEQLLAQPRELPMILTVRARDEGGTWTGGEAERIALLERLGLQMPGYVDVELATWQRSANVRQKIGLVCAVGPHDDTLDRPKNRLILSHHDPRRTPPDLGRVFSNLAAAPAAVNKAVFAARDATDACRVLVQVARQAPQRAVIGLAAGAAGLASRVLARKFGAFLTFATVARGHESAPGQPTIAELRDLYRWDDITPQTRVYGVVGWPVAHSLSPALHNAAMRAAGINGVYVPLPVGPTWPAAARFLDYVRRHDELDVVGLSVTQPHKENALRWLTERGFRATEVAHRCGAVNTLARRADGTWEGENTDVAGVSDALRCATEPLHGARVAVLGAGGAARAAILALQAHACEVTVFNRSPERARRLAHELRCAWRPWAERNHYRGDALMNCTSVGMWPDMERSPLDDAARLPPLVFDTVYRPAQTRLLRQAQAQGSATISGLEMFLAQAAAQFEWWHSASAPLDVMRATLAVSAG